MSQAVLELLEIPYALLVLGLPMCATMPNIKRIFYSEHFLPVGFPEFSMCLQLEIVDG